MPDPNQAQWTKALAVEFPAIVPPNVSATSSVIIYCDPTTGKLMISQNGSAYATLFGGLTSIPASTTAGANLNIATGVAPTSPVNGDLWQDGTHAYMQIGGATKQLDN